MRTARGIPIGVVTLGPNHLRWDSQFVRNDLFHAWIRTPQGAAYSPSFKTKLTSQLTEGIAEHAELELEPRAAAVWGSWNVL